MKYSVLVIDSNNVYDYWQNAAEGVRFDDLNKEELDVITRLSLRQDFSIVTRVYEEEE